MAVEAAGNENVLDDINDALLLAAREFGSGLKNQAQFSDGSGSALFGCLASDQVIGTDAEHLGQDGKLFGTHGGRFAFPERIGAMGNAEFFSNLCLGEPRLLAQLVKAFSEGRALS